ncbi:conserved hypothetical protein [Culex quinquefasciatus]|uniref:Kelch repeat protein n=1 Tax=Culex quinquefasciatus TaxID=7176 RepID=B0WWP3_CULQU|nr:conserved hypothetical protein [Culex quinquefasciatus]|eukprot:XP_001861815.1 conserved hypothetical protein [Culex quinquefasciatus]
MSLEWTKASLSDCYLTALNQLAEQAEEQGNRAHGGEIKRRKILIEEARSLLLADQEESEASIEIDIPVPGSSVPPALSGTENPLEGGSGTNPFVLGSITNELDELPDEVGLAVVNGQLYAVGGFDGTAYLKTIEVYDPETNQWRLCGCMNYRRLGGGVGVMRAPQTENYMW